MPAILEKVLRLGEGRILKKLAGIAKQVAALEEGIAALTDEELREETDRFKERLADGETLDDILAEAFAVVREAAKRTLGQRHFDVQIMGGAALHQGNIAEMKTGEGKTLVATLPAYLNALTGKGVHIITVNDYLAEYQSELMGRVFRFLGLTTGCILSRQTPAKRREQYAADITYGTNNEFGFDYLRDNMAWREDDLVQRGHYFAIIDEADSILIDEARTPLIISGPSDGEANRWYTEFAKVVRRLKRDVDYEVDEKKHTVGILEPGIEKIEDHLGIENLYESLNTPLIGFLNNAIKAKELFRRDKDYIVTRGEVLIVDEHTGRVLPGRRYNEGMHQAIEAKEGVAIKAENQTLATITLQNYFRLYDKRAGMTGTAETEAAEFQGTYKLGVVPIPTNLPMRRIDQGDVIYKTELAKFTAVVEDIIERHEKGQPILVGTTSVEKSELLSDMLKKRGVKHEVLNAKQHEREAAVVSMAGRKGAVTVSTNMAGRGTDIMLGGNVEFLANQRMKDLGLDPVDTPDEFEARWPEVLEEVKESVAAEHNEVVELGGLYVLGTERHESRRIDNQLRGRSGRQGDPGESRFYLSMEDHLMKRFKSGMAESIMNRSGFPDDMPLEFKIVTKAIQSAQAQVEAQNFEIRKNVLKYDDVMSRQREVIYRERRQVLAGADMQVEVQQFMKEVITSYVTAATAAESPDEWDLETLWTALKSVYPITITVDEVIEQAGGVKLLTQQLLLDEIISDAEHEYARREEELGSDAMRDLERRVVLSVLDRKWREHLYEMDYLKEGIGLRAMAQRDPLVEYQNEGYLLFKAMTDAIKEESVGFLFFLKVEVQQVEGDEVEVEGEGIETYEFEGHEGDDESAAEQDEDEDEDEDTDASGVTVTAGASFGVGSKSKPAKKLVAKGLGEPRKQAPLQYTSAGEDGGIQTSSAAGDDDAKQTYPGTGRNEPCPCGSGKKYKVCHGKNEAAQ